MKFNAHSELLGKNFVAKGEKLQGAFNRERA